MAWWGRELHPDLSRSSDPPIHACLVAFASQGAICVRRRVASATTKSSYGTASPPEPNALLSVLAFEGVLVSPYYYGRTQRGLWQI